MLTKKKEHKKIIKEKTETNIATNVSTIDARKEVWKIKKENIKIMDFVQPNTALLQVGPILFNTQSVGNT